MDFSKHGGGSVVSIDERNVCVIHASGEVQKIRNHFAGTLQMEYSGENDDFMVWRQQGFLLAAVNRFNVVCFWNTLTGKLVGKQVLAEHH